MSANEATGESTIEDNTLIDELVTRMTELEEKYREKFNANPLHRNLIEIISSISEDKPVNSMQLCAIFSDYSEAFLDKAFEYNQTMDQNGKLNKELYKANDLIRRLTDENEYHLSKLKFLAKQLEIYKDSWRGKLTEQSVERQIHDLVGERDGEVEDLRKKLMDAEDEIAKKNREIKSYQNELTPSKKNPVDDESRQFSDLKNSNFHSFKGQRPFDSDKLFNDLTNMDHNTLAEH